MKYAVIENDVIVNCIIWNGIDLIPSEWELIENEDGFLRMGMYRVDGEWIESPPVDS